MNIKENYNYKDLKRAKRVQRNRLKKRILKMLENNENQCIFLTFTFNNKVLKKTNKATRFRYIKQYLNQYANQYILNIDYGANNKREHYHAIATPKYKIFLYGAYNRKYGYIHGEIIGNLKRFANINKSLNDIAERLTEHSTKETTENNKIIYSRAQPKHSESNKINLIENQLILNEINRQKILNSRLETNDQEIKHPKAFYYLNNQQLIYHLSQKLNDNAFIYKAIKTDSKGFKELTKIYDSNSDIYKNYLVKEKNKNRENVIIFID